MVQWFRATEIWALKDSRATNCGSFLRTFFFFGGGGVEINFQD